jgi:CheY-like chemotaxis protein
VAHVPLAFAPALRYAKGEMPASLNILIVDDRPDSVLFLTEFLLSRKHRVATVGNGKEALAAVVRRRTANDPYDLMITEINLPGMDGLGLMRELKRRQEAIDFVISTAYAAMHPNLAHEAERLGCLGIFEKPADLARLDQTLSKASARKRTSPGTTKSEQPFFGTSRTVRAADVGTASLNRDRAPAGDGLERRGAPAEPAPPASYPSPLPFEDSPAQGNVRPGTSSYTPSESKPPPAAVALPAAPVLQPPSELFPADGPSLPAGPGTTRLRRTVTGTERVSRAAAVPSDGRIPDNSRAVACAHCAKPFMVANKPGSYSVICVHCGKLNRIEPLA